MTETARKSNVNRPPKKKFPGDRKPRMPSPRLHRVTSPYASAHTTQDIPNQEKTEVTRIIYSTFPPLP